jgi:hypothetical protein
MKKVIICGSISAAAEITAAQHVLEALGCEVEIPEGVKNLAEWIGDGAGATEKAERKVRLDLIRGYYEKMKDYDAALVVNPEKKGVAGYVGGNTLIEMAFAHILHKPLYILYPIPNMPYTSEMLAMKPTVLDGDVSKISELLQG